MTESGFHCAQCNLSEEDEAKLIFCDGCQQYFHCVCQDVTVSTKADDSWMCNTCTKSATEVNMEAVAKLMSQQLDLHRKNLEKRSRLVDMKLKLEQDKRELELIYEKEQIEKKILAEKEFNQKYKAERENWMKELNELTADRKKCCAEFEEYLKKITADKGEPTKNKRKKRKHRATSTKVGGAASTPNAEFEESFSGSDSSIESEEQRKQTSSRSTDKPTKAQLTARQYLSWKLPTFTGNPNEWPIFISSFNSSTEACGFSDLENLSRLQEAIKFPARELVGGLLVLPKAVPKVIESLRQLYGRPEQMLGTLLAKIRKTEAPKIDKLGTFIRFGTVVAQLCDHLEATRLQDHLVNPLLISEIVEKLPAVTQIEWVRYKRKQRKITLRTLTDFLADLVSVASEVVHYDEFTASNNMAGKVAKPREQQRSFAGVHDAAEIESSPSESRWPCVVCGETNHRIRNCEVFKEMELDERMEVVSDNNLCQICLNAHGNARCKMNIHCNVGNCQERHNSLLHPGTLR
ncbi:uncharacterized protein LOC120421887 [Culex pipiens pallens]|uniref:uncharacterized protein LOC120421887 n=1 Tax=Culex pipiens pallens TaxID=42434 RepID=UPI001955002C|nr:uncharacterized protein LOC120421887 [Culex pipiens pallens]